MALQSKGVCTPKQAIQLPQRDEPSCPSPISFGNSRAGCPASPQASHLPESAGHGKHQPQTPPRWKSTRNVSALPLQPGATARESRPHWQAPIGRNSPSDSTEHRCGGCPQFPFQAQQTDQQRGPIAAGRDRQEPPPTDVAIRSAKVRIDAGSAPNAPCLAAQRPPAPNSESANPAIGVTDPPGDMHPGSHLHQ